MQTIYLKLTDAWPLMKDADLLLWRGRGAISAYGRGIHRHASTLAWWDDEWMVLDTTWKRGASCRRLVSDVKAFSGKIDWFETNAMNLPDYDRQGVVRYMRRLIGTKYGTRNILEAIERHVPIVARFIKEEIDDDETPTHAPFCSDARSRADRISGGHDPIPFCADRASEPADLARSPFYRYRATLVWDDAMQEKVNLPEAKRIFSVPFFAMAT